MELRDVVLRDDLERLGRYDPARVRQRLRDEFSAQNTRIIVHDADDVGSIAVRRDDAANWVEHFYLASSVHDRGIGSAVLRQILDEDDARPFRLNVLHGSAAIRLYARHGFTIDSDDDVDVFMTRERPLA